MKSILLFFAALIFSMAMITPAQAQGFESTSSRTMNFRISPLPIFIGATLVDLDFKIADNLTLGPQLLYWKYSGTFDDSTLHDYDSTQIEGGIRVNWFANGVYNDGLYVGPSVNYYSMKVKATDTSTNKEVSVSAHGALLAAVVGYGWFWQNFNQMLGVGIASNIGDDAVLTDSNGKDNDVDDQQTRVTFEYSLGWTF